MKYFAIPAITVVGLIVAKFTRGTTFDLYDAAYLLGVLVASFGFFVLRRIP